MFSNPLLSPKVGDERPTVAIFDTAGIQKFQHMIDRFLRRNRTFEVGGICRKFPYHLLKTFGILDVIGTCND